MELNRPDAKSLRLVLASTLLITFTTSAAQTPSTRSTRAPVLEATPVRRSGQRTTNTGGSEDAVFVLRRGDDIAAVEWYSRTPQKVMSTIVVNEVEESRYTLDLDPHGSVTRFRLETPQAGKPPSVLSVRLRPDQPPDGENKEGQTKADERRGAAPYLDQAPAGMLEQVVRRARSVGGEKVEIPVYRFVGKKTLPAIVTFKGSDAARVEVGDKVFDLVIDREGRILAGQITAYGITIERLPSLPRTAYQAWSPYGTPPGAPYRAEEVRVSTPHGHTLAGTLTLPVNVKGRLPAMVLITGLGKNIRNNGNPPSIPFRQIADALSRRGIAVLRMDDRGVGESTGDAASATTFDEAEDIRAALTYLRKRRDIDPRRLGLVGWSEGGIIAPTIAATDENLRGIVLMCAPAGGRETAEYQIRYAVEHSPTVSPDEREATIAAALAEAGDTPRARSFLSMDGIPTARRVRVPVLLLHGTTDRHVPPSDATRLAAAFRSNGNDDVTVRLFPNLDHVFLPDPDGRASGWAFLPSLRVPSEVLETLAGWAARRLD